MKYATIKLITIVQWLAIAERFDSILPLGEGEGWYLRDLTVCFDSESDHIMFK